MDEHSSYVCACSRPSQQAQHLTARLGSLDGVRMKSAWRFVDGPDRARIRAGADHYQQAGLT